MCIILSDADKKVKDFRDLHLLQVVEAIAYSKESKSAQVYVDILLESKRDTPCDLYLVHRGKVTVAASEENLLCTKEKKIYANSHPEASKFTTSELLYKIYQHRVKSLKSGIKLFHERRNCYLTEKEAVRIEHWDQGSVRIEPVLEEQGKDNAPPFTAFKIYNLQPGYSWQRYVFDLKGSSYEYLVDNVPMFWVDGPDRVKKQLLDDELPHRNYLLPECDEFFKSNIRDFEIPIKAYDVVIPQPGVKGIDSRVGCEPVTADIFDAPINDPDAAKCANLFVSRTMDFWISVWYKDDERIANSTSLPEAYKNSLINH